MGGAAACVGAVDRCVTIALPTVPLTYPARTKKDLDSVIGAREWCSLCSLDRVQDGAFDGIDGMSMRVEQADAAHQADGAASLGSRSKLMPQPMDKT